MQLTGAADAVALCAGAAVGAAPRLALGRRVARPVLGRRGDARVVREPVIKNREISSHNIISVNYPFLSQE